MQDDFPTLAPGKSWSYKWKPRFPGDFDGSSWDVKEPGEYRLKVTYENRQVPGGEEYQDFVKGSWTGVVGSNEIVVKLVAGAH